MVALPDSATAQYTSPRPVTVATRPQGQLPSRLALSQTGRDTRARRLLADESSAVFAPRSRAGASDALLFFRDSTLMAQTFDAGTLQLVGDAFAIGARASFSTTGVTRQVAATVSRTGVLAYLSESNERIRSGVAQPKPHAYGTDG